MSWLLLLCVGVQGALEFSLILDQDAAGYKANKRAVEALQRGDAEKALARLNKALKKGRQSVQIQNSVGVALMYLAKRRSGRKDQLQAAATGAFRSAAELASEAAKAEDLEVALGNEALARRHLEAERLNRRGIALDQQNRWEEAAAQFRRALQVAPGDPWAANNLGTVMYKNATHRSAGWEEAGPLYADAQKLVEHALRQLPGNPAITKSLKEVKRLQSFLNAWRQNADLLQLPVPADMLRQVAVDNTLVCTWSGGGDKFAKMALNLFSSIRLNAPRWAPAFVVLALDVETESFLRRKGITTWLHETVDIYMTRWRLLAGLVAAGFEVLLTDTDVVFLSDPFPYFFQDADLEVMTDHLFPERDLWDARWRDEEHINTGFMYARSSPGALALVQRFIQAHHSPWAAEEGPPGLGGGFDLFDQRIFGRFVRRQIEAGRCFSLMENLTYGSSLDGAKFTVRVLHPEVVAHGAAFFWLRWSRLRGLERPPIAHANFGRHKVYFLRDRNVWFEPFSARLLEPPSTDEYFPAAVLPEEFRSNATGGFVRYRHRAEDCAGWGVEGVGCQFLVLASGLELAAALQRRLVLPEDWDCRLLPMWEAYRMPATFRSEKEACTFDFFADAEGFVKRFGHVVLEAGLARSEEFRELPAKTLEPTDLESGSLAELRRGLEQFPVLQLEHPLRLSQALRARLPAARRLRSALFPCRWLDFEGWFFARRPDQRAPAAPGDGSGASCGVQGPGLEAWIAVQSTMAGQRSWSTSQMCLGASHATVELGLRWVALLKELNALRRARQLKALPGRDEAAELDLAHLQDVAQEGLSALAAAGQALRDAANSEKDVVGVDPTASSAGYDSKMVDSMLQTVLDCFSQWLRQGHCDDFARGTPAANALATRARRLESSPGCAGVLGAAKALLREHFATEALALQSDAEWLRGTFHLDCLLKDFAEAPWDLGTKLLSVILSLAPRKPTHEDRAMSLSLKPSEYGGLKGTAVAGRVVIMVEQEVKSKAASAAAATPSERQEVLESKLAAAIFHEVGDLIALTGATVISTAQMYSTSRLPYHLRVKGIVGTQVLVQKLESLPWSGVPAHHPLVPLQSLARVKDRQQICVAAQVDDNPGAIERDTVQGRVLVCNAIVQQNGVRARCAFWREHAEKLATCQAGTCILLYQVLVEKKKEGSWEIGSWRGTQILECPEELAKNIGERIMEPGDCRMLTLIPTRNWKECEAVQSTLSALVGTIVPGQLRKVDTVFLVSGLQIMAHPDAAEEKRVALRAVFADSDCQCSMVLYHDHVELALQEQGYSLPNPCKDTAELRSEVRNAFRSALWTCKVTFRENDYQQILELECRHLTPFLPFNQDCPDLTPHMLELPRCSLGGGCPVAALRDLRVDTDLGSLTIQEIDAPSVRALVMFNEVQLPDDESLQQDPQSASAMRVKRSVDCCLSVPDAETLLPFRSKIRAAGPASAVNWILRARPGEVHQVVIMQADAENEWSVLWHVEVHEKAALAVNAYYSHIISKQTAAAALSYASEWTPGKRARTLRDSMPTPFKTSSAWQDQC
ncbi:unnamed protein product [Effrenium voratum]|uniref:Nucleotide-diphospho-sugar transferase domain-containing protein n=1 Tax=Effrenium voratum TaxID=2562239 RepID=A0AA36J1Q7_9DINO|nr:unnamed protein product [Effrenium voratum]